MHHIVTKDFYSTLKLSNCDCSICETTIFYIWQRTDQCLTSVERVIELYEQEAILNVVHSEVTTNIYNNELKYHSKYCPSLARTFTHLCGRARMPLRLMCSSFEATRESSHFSMSSYERNY